jgi:hypothetical protein
VSVILSQCVYCGKPLNRAQITIDHVIPTCRGGSNQPSNKAPCCTECNQDKGHLTAAEYLAVRHNRADLKAMKRAVAVAEVLGMADEVRPKQTKARALIVAEQQALRAAAAARFREEVPSNGRVRWAVEQDGKTKLGPWVDAER